MAYEAGVPEIVPEDASNINHVGLLVIENSSRNPLGLVAVGRNEYTLPTDATTGALPLIFGAMSGSARTVMENGGRYAVEVPSVARIEMLPYVPTFVVGAGVPYRRPLVASKVAHEGLLPIENVSRAVAPLTPG
jgi:hypothetical protein